MTDHNVAQRAVLRALLEAHPRMLGVEQLVGLLDDVPRSREALRVLVDDGLATQLGDRVGLSRAAVRFDALSPVRVRSEHAAHQLGRT
jgi:hypothetical protein